LFINSFFILNLCTKCCTKREWSRD